MEFKLIHQSSWISNFYNYLGFPERRGFLVEIGVGNVIDYPGRDELQRRSISHIPETYIKLGSNTTELMELGWQGLYIDPVQEYLKQCSILHRARLHNLVLVNHGATDQDELLTLGDYESFVSGTYNLTNACYYKRQIQCIKTNTILQRYCPKTIDLLSIDVEGMEDRVIKGINFDMFRFNMIIVEINRVSRATIRNILPSEYVEVCWDNLNAVYLNKNL